MFNRILVLCIGNICRSPLAEALLSRALPGVEVDSAGLGALVDYPAAPEMQKIAQDDYELDLSGHRAKQMSKQLVQSADVVFVMSDGQKQHVKEKFPHLGGRVLLLSHFSSANMKGINVADPYKKSEEAFIVCAQQISIHVDAISKALKR